MAKLYITQYARKGRDDRGPTDAGEEPSLGTIVVDFTGGATASAVLDGKTTMVRLFTDAACRFAFGTVAASPGAAPNGTPMPANSVDYFGVPAELVRPGNLAIAAIVLA